MDGKNDQSEQMNQIRNFVTQGFDVMIVLVQASPSRMLPTSATKQVSRLFTSTVRRILREERLMGNGWYQSYLWWVLMLDSPVHTRAKRSLKLENKGDADGDGVVRYIMVQGDPENVDAQYRTEKIHRDCLRISK